jgi:pyrimidine-nucleoside phosphorylase
VSDRADKKLYALRDVTGTVECIPLICASILSKKLAEGTQVLVGDVKFGRGAFMKEKEKARELAHALVRVSNAMRTPMRAVLTSMDQPLGRAVGQSLEVIESIACLRGEGPADTMAVTYALGEQMLLLAGKAKTPGDARAQLEHSIASGAALEKFRAMIVAQGGDGGVVDDPARLPQAKIRLEVPSPASGFVQDVDPMDVALAVLRLGGGRAKADAHIDHAVGVDRLVKVGERVEQGAPLAVIHANDQQAAETARGMFEGGIIIGPEAIEPPVLIDEVIG